LRVYTAAALFLFMVTGEATVLQFQRSRRSDDHALSYLRPPKTGSTTVHDTLHMALAQNPVKCAGLHARDHSAFASDVAGPKMTIIREPCDRLMSQYNHAKPHGNYTLLEWGHKLLTDKTLAEKIFVKQSRYATKDADKWPVCIWWAQSNYIDNETEVGCTPTLRRDLQRIVSKHLPGCVVPDVGVNNAHDHASGDAAECELAAQLYPEDVKLWKEHCGR
jgi:hypothetical protein